MKTLLLIIFFINSALANQSLPGTFDWSDSAAWTNGLPSIGDDVIISADSTVTIDVGFIDVNSISVHGELNLSNMDMEIYSGYIMVHSEGRFVGGTYADPLTHEIMIELNEPDNGSAGMGDRVLGVMTGGFLSLHGKYNNNGNWTQLAASVNPGDDVIQLINDVDWVVGQKLVIAASGYDAFEAEEVTITQAINDSEFVVSPPFNYTHHGYQENMGEKTMDFRAEVGLLSKNITIQSPEESTADRFGFHGMFMPNSTVNISGVEFLRGGQIRKKARYPIHWHRGADNNDGSDDYIKHSSIHNSFQRGIVIHGINEVLVEDNVVYNVWGHAYIPSEDGVEIDNQFINNLAVLYKRKALEDFSFPIDGHTQSDQAEHRPSGFWYRNYHNTLIGNHAAGGEQGIGFFIDSRTLGQTERQLIARDERPIIFEDNLAHSHFRSIEGGSNPSYGPRTRATGLMVGNYKSRGPVVFNRFTTYKNSFAGVWIEDKKHALTNSILSDSSVGILARESTLKDILFNQNSSNTLGGPVQ